MDWVAEQIDKHFPRFEVQYTLGEPFVFTIFFRDFRWLSAKSRETNSEEDEDENLLHSNTWVTLACHSACVQIPKQSSFHGTQQKGVISCDYVLNVFSFLFVFWLESLYIITHWELRLGITRTHGVLGCVLRMEMYSDLRNVSRHVYGTTIHSN